MMPLYPGMYPGMYPAIADPRIQTAAAATNPLQRGIIGIEALQAINGMFMEDATTTPAQVVTGTFSFTQNFATDLLFANNAQYKIYINSSSTSTRPRVKESQTISKLLYNSH